MDKLKEEILEELGEVVIATNRGGVEFKLKDVMGFEKVESFLESSLDKVQQSTREETLEKVKKQIAKSFRGCACGLHGYQVLPDCNKEDHGDDCADCILQSLKSGGTNE